MNENHMHTEYKGHRIYILQLRNTLWAASVAKLTTLPGHNRTAPGDVVDGIGGEYGSRDQAIAAAKHFIDEH